MTEIYIFCVCFVQPGLSGISHQHRIWQNTLSKKSPIQVIPSHQQCAKNRQCSSGTNET
ncbi:hypothetical protein HMPREF1606_04006 [Escherichia coli 908522]|nr:hypothetical protein HMPREF1606_04006 [Escherichia coli 908522]